MTRHSLAKLVLALVGIGIFLMGVRVDDPAYRWVGIVLVALAFLIRFLPGGAAPRR